MILGLAAAASTNEKGVCLTHTHTYTHTHTQVAPDAIHGTLSALGADLDLLAAFKVPPMAAAAAAAAAGPGYGLRAAVCYVGHHYLAFVLAEELGLWLCFDDAHISLVGTGTRVDTHTHTHTHTHARTHTHTHAHTHTHTHTHNVHTCIQMNSE